VKFFDGTDKIPLAPPPMKIAKTIGDIGAILEAQRIYNPNIPSVPSPKAPPQAQVDMGVASKSDMSGSWGKNG